MSLAAAMLYGLPGDPEEVDDKTLVIDHYTRTITIPKGISNLGVENDDDVLRLNFKMPRYLGTTDLYTGFNFRVNYINAQGKDDYYDVEDATVAGDDILFTWRVGPTATAYRGTTRFNVSILKTDSDSVVQQGYHTAVASLNVKEGLECTKRPVSRYSDILDQWERRLFGYGDTEEAALAAVSAEQQELIIAKGTEVLDTIPEVYTVTYNLANEGARTKADAIICSAVGETISVSDSSDDYLRSLHLFGKTEQVRTTGKNLLNNIAQTSTINGITYTDIGNGMIRAHGTASDDSFLTIGSVTYTGGTEYRISGCPSGGAMNKYTLYAVYGDNLYSFDTGEGITFTPATDMTKNVSIKITKGTIVSSLLFKPMVCLASNTDTTYEPYSSGYASPSPECPQDMVDAENTSVRIYGKNLVCGDETRTATMSNGITIGVTSGSSEFVLGGTQSGTSNSSAFLVRSMTLYPGTYTLSVYGLEMSDYINIKQLSGLQHYLFTSATQTQPKTFTVDETVEIGVEIVTYSTSSYNNSVVKLQLEYGTNATEYEPYAAVQSIDSNREIWGVPVDSGGNYTDLNGQQWICDEVDFERGVLVKRIAEYVFTGAERWNVSGIQDGLMEGFTRYDGSAVSPGALTTESLWTHYVYKGTHVQDGYGAWVYNGDAYNVGVRMVTEHASVTELSQYLAALHAADTPIVVRYVRKYPIESPLTTGEVIEFKSFRSNYPNTTVINSSGAPMLLRYNADTETWINNLIDEKIAAAIASR
jgi:hypothetical protein